MLGSTAAVVFGPHRGIVAFGYIGARIASIVAAEHGISCQLLIREYGWGLQMRGKVSEPQRHAHFCNAA